MILKKFLNFWKSERTLKHGHKFGKNEIFGRNLKNYILSVLTVQETIDICFHISMKKLIGIGVE